MVDGARSVLNDLLADVYIFTDHMTGPEAGQSPGYGLMLVAETTTGCFISSECTANAALKVVVLILLCSFGLLKLLVHLIWAARHALVDTCGDMLSCPHIDSFCIDVHPEHFLRNFSCQPSLYAQHR